MKMISGSEAVEMVGFALPRFLENLDIIFQF